MMKQIGRIFVIVACFLVIEGRRSSERVQQCPQGSHYVNQSFNRCEFTCRSEGVDFTCANRIEGGGCNCQFDKYFNRDTKQCEEVKCDNMDCFGKTNEAYFICESGSRNNCGCESLVTLDCNSGCMCKNGFCRQNGVCVPRNCPPGKKSPFNN